jgi:hypothetical protein
MLPCWPNLYQMILREPRATLRFNDWNDCPFLYISPDDKPSHGSGDRQPTAASRW